MNARNQAELQDKLRYLQLSAPMLIPKHKLIFPSLLLQNVLLMIVDEHLLGFDQKKIAVSLKKGVSKLCC